MKLHQRKNSMSWILLLLIIGLLAGTLSGLIGIGGGILLVPALVYFMQYGQHQAQGTSLGVLTLPVVVLGAWQYYRTLKGTATPMDLKVIAILAVGFVVGGFLGSTLALKIDKDALRKLFGLVMLYTAFKMLQVDTWLIGLFKKG